MRTRQVPDRAVRDAEDERVRPRRAGLDLESGFEEDLSVQRDDDDVVETDRLDVQVAGGVAVLDGLDEHRRPLFVLLGDADLPVLRVAVAALLERRWPVPEDRLGPRCRDGSAT